MSQDLSKYNKQLIKLHDDLGDAIDRVNDLYKAQFINRGDRDLATVKMYEQRLNIFNLMLERDIVGET
jgi:hypothetical protein